MAVMASETSTDPVSALDKAQPLLNNNSTVPATAVNGDANHHDAPSDEPATQNGTNHTAVNVEATTNREENKVVKTQHAEDENAAPVEHVESGLTAVAAFLPAASEPVSSTGEPPATSTEPAAVEAAVSSVRDEPLPDVQNETISSQDTAPAAPPTALDNTNSALEDKMDTSEDVLPPAAEGMPEQADALMGDVVDDSVPAADADLSSVVKTLPGTSAPSPPAATQSQSNEQTNLGQVRQREDDEESEPRAKRAKTESMDEEAALPPADVPLASTETAPSDAPPAPVSTSTSLAGSAAPPASLPPLQPMSLDSNPMTNVQMKFLKEQVRKAKKTKSAAAFVAPVDPVALNIPHYLDYIKRPMDLTTLEKNLGTGVYATPDDFMADFTLIIQNSYTFNGPNHPVSQMGSSLKAYFDKCVSSMPKGAAAQAPAKAPKSSPAAPKAARPARTVTAPIPAPPPPPPTAKSPVEPAGFLDQDGNPMIRRTSTTQTDRPKREIIPPKRDLPYSGIRPKKKKAQLELKFCDTVLQELNKKKHALYAYAFMNPVDPVALNIPTYLRVIKKPMDFGTVASKLKMGEYANSKEFLADSKLVFQNCYKFNPPTDEVNKMGHLLEAAFDAAWREKDSWIADNQPQSEPPSEDEEEDVEDELVEDPAVRRMQEIQQQIAALSAEAMQLTTTATRPSPKAAVKAKPAKSTASKKSGAPKATTLAAPKATKPKAKPKIKKLTIQQKREVSDGIAALDEAKMTKAVTIIRAGCPHLAAVHDDELELDIDEIPDDVVYKLWEFVQSTLPKKERDPSPEYELDDDDDYVAREKASSHRKKNKPMKAKEQEERLAQLKDKLSGGNGSGSSASPAAAAQRESDDEASESSEEE